MTKKSKILLTLGANLKKLRRERNVTQELLAELAGLDRSYVGQVERGERNVSFFNLVSLARAMDLPVADLTVGI